MEKSEPHKMIEKRRLGNAQKMLVFDSVSLKWCFREIEKKKAIMSGC